MLVNIEPADEFEDNLSDVILEIVRESIRIAEYEAQYPEYMRIKEAMSFLNCSRYTLLTKFFPAGLKVIVVDGLQYVAKRDAIAFMEAHRYDLSDNKEGVFYQDESY